MKKKIIIEILKFGMDAGLVFSVMMYAVLLSHINLIVQFVVWFLVGIKLGYILDDVVRIIKVYKPVKENDVLKSGYYWIWKKFEVFPAIGIIHIDSMGKISYWINYRDGYKHRFQSIGPKDIGRIGERIEWR